jgi:hypothetical protein
MKTIKKLSFAVVTFVALSFSLSSCDAIADLASKEVEVVADPISFSVGGLTGAPMQKVGAAAVDTSLWLDKTVDISTPLNAELKKNGMTSKNVRNLYVIGSHLKLITGVTQSFSLGNLKIYIDGALVATAFGAVSPSSALIRFLYPKPYDLFAKFGAGSVKLKISSDQPKPSVKFDFEMYNTYKSKISAIAN